MAPAPRGRAANQSGLPRRAKQPGSDPERFDPVESLAAEGSGSLGADERDWRASGCCRAHQKRSHAERIAAAPGVKIGPTDAQEDDVSSRREDDPSEPAVNPPTVHVIAQGGDGPPVHVEAEPITE